MNDALTLNRRPRPHGAKPRRRLAMMLFLSLIAPALSGCAKWIQPAETPVVKIKRIDCGCKVFPREIAWSVNDTKQTIRDIRDYNARYAAICADERRGDGGA